MRNQLSKVRRSIDFTSEAAIDDRITDIELWLQTETVPLKQEKDRLKELQELKRNRQAKIRQAKDKAEDDLKVFRAEREQKFQQEVAAKAAADPTAELSGKTQADVAAVERDYDQNKARTIKYVIDRVLDVPMTLTATQTQALKMSVV